jgi:hypothetical protein
VECRLDECLNQFKKEIKDEKNNQHIYYILSNKHLVLDWSYNEKDQTNPYNVRMFCSASSD